MPVAARSELCSSVYYSLTLVSGYGKQNENNLLF